MTKNTLGHKSIAVLVTIAVLTTYSMVVLSAPGVVSGELSVFGEVALNGGKAISGGTIFSNSTVVTADKSTATLSLAKLGRIDLFASTRLKLSFAEGSIIGILDTGSARIYAPTGVSVSLATRDGAVEVDGSQTTLFTVTSDNGETDVATEQGLAKLRSGDEIQLIAPGETGVAGPPLPQQIVARLVTRGGQPITVNGASTSSGASILTGATIETPDQVGATINLGSLGSLDVAPNTKLTLDFDQNGNVKVTLIAGCVILRTRKNANGQVDTPQGNAGKTERKKGGILDVCFLAGATAAVVNQGAAAKAGARTETSSSQGPSNTGTSGEGAAAGLHGGALAALLVAIGGSVAAVIWGVTHKNDLNFNGTVTIVSPTR